MPTKQSEADALLKSLSSPQRRPWKRRTVIFVTVVLVIFIVYLIMSSISPSLKISNNSSSSNNNIVSTEPSNPHKLGSDPFLNWDECDSVDSPPALIGYHIHALFDGNDAASISFAYQAYHDFIEYTNPAMPECEFAHSYPSSSQTEVCYFPTTWQETDFPIPSNAIFQTSNYGFFIPTQHLQHSLTFWMQHHSDMQENLRAFDYVVHTVSGCQFNDHTKWLLASGGYQDELVMDNLVCCHHGPALCTCNLVQYQLSAESSSCLGIQFVDQQHAVFVDTECEDAVHRGVGTWREVFYNVDRNWMQIENYGDVKHPMYLCLGVADGGDGEEAFCDIGSELQLIDCSYHQDLENDVWVSPQTQLMYDVQSNQMKLVACTQGEDLCVNINADPENEGVLKLSVASCDEATVFGQRHFFP
eukprot:CAMPEP_0197028790 /NCGR_PEP_ID=MMETSP1384-20130603/8397_1 /TAXON_ID=29189 /ORGANISM="Ammonia sp." /LENGTH=415 /DNA_ID=CAMNT_0042457847 /DNA_START=15 /DNA_END=1262 /DNA_ORIENTATION=-